MDKKMHSGIMLTLLFAVVLTVPFNIPSANTDASTADYCWVAGESLDIGFSKYGEMISYDDTIGIGVGLQYPRYEAVGTHDQTEGTSRDPFANEGISMQFWLNGWFIEIRYTHRFLGDRYILTAAMFADMANYGGDWIVGKEIPFTTAPYGGRKTTGYAETEDIQVLYDDPRFFKALCTTHIYDWRDTNEDEVLDHPTETWPVVDVMITTIFNKAKKAITVQKDVELVIDPKILGSPVDCQFSNRGEWDLGADPEYSSYAHFYHQRNMTGFGDLWHTAPGIMREFRVSMIGPTDPPRTVVLPPGNLAWYGYPVVDRSERVYVNGVLQERIEDYIITESTGIIDFWYDLDPDDEIVVYYKLPKYYEDGGWHWDGWEGIPDCYDVAQLIGSDEEYVGFAAFWPTLSDYTVDGWANVFNPLLNVSQPDMIPEGSEPDIPFLAGEWDFMLDYVGPWSVTFKGITGYGLTDLTDGDDRNIGPDHEDVIDGEILIQIDQVFRNLWTVDDDGPADFHTIQEAINAASPDHTIYVRAGTYYENVVVNKTVSLIGENKEDTIVDGKGTGRVVVITANHVKISGFTIQRSGNSWSEAGIYIRGHKSNITNNNIVNNRHGVFLEYYSNNIVSGNNITANVEQGIWLAYSSYNTIYGNNIANARDDGIHLWYSQNNDISGNNIANNEYGYGIRLAYSSNNIFRANSLADNKYNFEVAGNTLSHFIQDIDTSNSVDDKPVYYWINRRDLVVPLDAGYVALTNCTRIQVKNLNLTKNGQGILLAYTANSSITQSNAKGIYFWQSSNNAISENEITNNGHGYGIHLEHSLNNSISGNEVTNHWYGIYFVSSLHNTMSGNNITASEYGVYLSKSSNNRISGNAITDSKYGIKLYASSNNTISGNNITSNTWIGINFHESPNNLIAENNITNNLFGIWVEGHSSINNSILRNNITNNGYSIFLVSSSNNEFYHNNFINNTHQTSPYTYSQTWDDGYPSGGNYWSDYEQRYPDAKELDESGIWDTPYVIDENNHDSYPLMEPWTPTPPIPTTIDELATKIEELGSEAEIDNQGVVTSLLGKLDVAQKLIEEGKIDQARNTLNAFINEVQAQAERHITREAAEFLIESAEYLLSNL